MPSSRALMKVLFVCFSFIASDIWAAGAGQGTSTGSAPSSSGLPSGVSYQADDRLGKFQMVDDNDSRDDYLILCYKMIELPDAASAQPVILVPVDKRHLDGNLTDCDPIPGQAKLHGWDKYTKQYPLVQGKFIGIAIDASAVKSNAIELINLNVTSQPGTPISPTLIRATVSQPAAGTTPNEAFTILLDQGPPLAPTVNPATKNNGIYYVVWPNRMAADSIPNVMVNVILGPTDKTDAGKVSSKSADGTIYRTVSVLNTTLPQVHAISSFNLTTAVVFSTIHNHSFGYRQPAAGTSGPGVPVETGHSPIVDPVLFFTYYPTGIDAEQGWKFRDLIPGLSIGLSLSSPASNFYFGGTSEFPFVRNVQLQYGYTIAKTAHLAPASTFNPPPSGTNAPTTVNKFSRGGYIGVSFDVLGFVQTLFGGGGKSTTGQ
jgi:hypothetical protein